MTVISTQVSPIIVLVLGLFSLAAIGAGVAAYWKSKYSETQLAILKSTNQDQDARIKFLEGENKRINELLEVETNARKALEEVVTGKKLLEEILQKVTDHNQKSEKVLLDIFSRDTKILKALDSSTKKNGGEGDRND